VPFVVSEEPTKVNIILFHAHHYFFPFPRNLSAQPITFPTPDARVCMNPSSSAMGCGLDLGWVSTNGARGGGGGGALPVGGGVGSDDGVDGSGPKWISEGRPSKSSANACRIFFWRTVRDLAVSYEQQC
jgi:hypothetical protein